MIADFTFRGEGLIVEFADASEGAVVTWLWFFGDQEQSQVRNPTHQYPRPGTYIVRLTVCGRPDPDPVEDCDSRERSVTVSEDGPPS